MITYPIYRRRAGFSLIELLVASLLLAVCAVAITRTWQFCYAMHDATRNMQAAKNLLEQEMERVRQLNWAGLSEQTAWAARYYYDRSGGPIGAPSSASTVTGGYVSYLKVETMNQNAASLTQTATVDTTGGNSGSLRRVTVRVQPTGVSAVTTPPAAEAVTYVTLGGP